MVIMSKFLSNSGLIFSKISKIKQENPSLSAVEADPKGLPLIYLIWRLGSPARALACTTQAARS